MMRKFTRKLAAMRRRKRLRGIALLEKKTDVPESVKDDEGKDSGKLDGNQQSVVPQSVIQTVGTQQTDKEQDQPVAPEDSQPVVHEEGPSRQADPGYLRRLDKRPLTADEILAQQRQVKIDQAVRDRKLMGHPGSGDHLLSASSTADALAQQRKPSTADDEAYARQVQAELDAERASEIAARDQAVTTSLQAAEEERPLEEVHRKVNETTVNFQMKPGGSFIVEFTERQHPGRFWEAGLIPTFASINVSTMNPEELNRAFDLLKKGFIDWYYIFADINMDEPDLRRVCWIAYLQCHPHQELVQKYKANLQEQGIDFKITAPDFMKTEPPATSETELLMYPAMESKFNRLNEAFYFYDKVEHKECFNWLRRKFYSRYGLNPPPLGTKNSKKRYRGPARRVRTKESKIVANLLQDSFP